MATSDWRDNHADQNLRMAQKMLEQQGEIKALRAQLADERARVLDEVQAVLRDHQAYARWYFDGATAETLQAGPSHIAGVALYLRDTLGAGGDVIIPAGTLKVGEVVHLEASGTIESEQVGYLVTGDRCDRCGDTNYDDERVCLTCTYPDDPCSRAYLEQP